jgi:hypothetical protein
MRKPSGGRRHRGRIAQVALMAVAVTTLPVAAVTTGAAAATDDPVLTWARSATAFDAESVGRSVAVDGLGNTLVTGSFENRATFGDGDRAVELVSHGFEDVFVAKYDPAGELVWARSAGSTSFDEGFAVDTDAAGNVYVAGEVWGAGGAFGTVNLPSGAFVARFAPDGSLTWVRGESGLFGVGDLAVDSAGNAYVAGALSGTVAFGEGASEVTLTARSSAADVFLAAYRPDGTLAWARDAGGVGQDRGLGVDANDAGQVVVSGSFTGPTTFGSGASAVTLPAGGSPSAFVAMYRSSGEFVWARGAESGFAEARDVAVDASGRASVVGRFENAIAFMGATGPIELTAPQFTLGVFLATLEPAGTTAWAAAGTTDSGLPDGWSVAVDGTRVVIGGEFSGESITFGTGTDAVTLDNVNSSPDAYVASFTAGGALAWARAAGGAFTDAAYGVALGTDSVSFTGQYQFRATFGSGADQIVLGSDDSLAEPVFVARYSTAGAAAPTRIVTPSRIAGTGSATVRVVGAGLLPGTTFDLVGPGGVVLSPSRLEVKPSGQEVEGRFELLDAPLGPWTVRLTVPGEGETLFPGAITVVAPGGNDENPLWLSLSIRDTVRVGRPVVATLSVGNRTDRDLAGVPLVLEGLPPGTEVTPLWNDIELPTDVLPGLPPPPAPAEVPLLLEAGDGTLMLPVLTGRVPANGRSDLPVEITFPRGTVAPATLTWGGCQPGWSGDIDPVPPPGDPPPVPGGPSVDCLRRLFQGVVLQALDVVPLSGCVPDVAKQYVAQQIVELVLYRGLGAAYEAAPNSATPATDLVKQIVDLVASCLVEAIPGNKIIRAAELGWRIFRAIDGGTEVFQACTSHIPPSRRQVRPVTATDPNDKVGPDGAGEEGFTTPDVPFDYTIYFENLATATAPAQRVVISDAIDTAVFDPATIELGAITLADGIVAVPPPGLREWSTAVEFGHPDLLLGVDVSWTEATGTLTWTLDTLDRATGLPTEDPLAGFLPPNLEPPEGEGSVRFLIEPRTRADGTQMTNEATIVFDTNEPIATGPWTNTLDGTAPSSSVAPLAGSTRSLSIPVSWTASDAVSGVGPVEIWVQRDGGTPELWQVAPDPAVTTGTFEGEDGSTYAFWTRARDRAGNVEPPPGSPDAVTTIRLNRPPTAAVQSVSTEQGTDLPITLTGSDPDGDPLTFEVVTPPAHGSLLGTGPALTYRPAPGFAGRDAFTFRASDGELVSAEATVAIEVVPTAAADAISLELSGPRRYANAGDLLSGDLSIRTDRHGIAAVTGSGTIEGIDGGQAAVSLTITRVGRTRLYSGTIRIDDPSAATTGFRWNGVLATTATAAGPDTVEGLALAVSTSRPLGPYLLRWRVTDAGP